MISQTKNLTYADYLALPETKQRCEIVDGTVLMPHGPTPDHQLIARNILFQCSSFVEERDIGVALMAPVDLVIQREPLRVRQPDVLFLSSQRTGIRGRAQLRGLQNLELPPDLVVEVLSPSNTRRDIEAKLQDYRQVGARECWLVSSEAETVEAIDLAPDTLRSLGIYGVEGELHSRVLPGFTLRLRQIFE
jgi:Uma2 family endonuclease